VTAHAMRGPTYLFPGLLTASKTGNVGSALFLCPLADLPNHVDFSMFLSAIMSAGMLLSIP